LNGATRADRYQTSKKAAIAAIAAAAKAAAKH
jgi:hypothetical protein